MPENKHARLLLRLIYLALGLLGLWLFLAFLLPWLLPFLIALALAWAIEPAVRLLERKLHLRRWLASAACTMALILVLCGLLGLILWRAGYEVALLLGRLPTLLSGLPTLGGHLEDWAYRFTVALPVQFQDFFQEALSGLISQGISLPNRFYDALAGLVTRCAAALPDGMLFLFTTALATYFSSAGRARLLAFLRRQAPQSWQGGLEESRVILKGAFGGWLRAQGILMLVTFGELAVGFLLLRVDLFLLLAALGLAITFGLMGVINMAHGEFIMIGAYTAYVVQNIFQAYFPSQVFDVYCIVAIILSFLAAASLGYVLERLVICRLYGRAADSLLVTWGISLILQQAARSIFGSPNVGVKAPAFLERTIRISGMVALPMKRIFILLIAVCCLTGVYVLMYKTRQGRNIRAVMQNREMAASLGVNTKRIDSMTFAIGSGLAGLAGCALTWIGAIGPTLGTNYIVDTFMTVVVGGAGSILGSVLGAGFIGIGQTAFEFLTSASIGKVLIFACVIVLLQFRPKGIFAVQNRALED